ncbi:MAG: ribonuclease E/G [Alphaproteobacteria bacterium]|nr:ribonuclease E/G [Alphaproteobacteria bacterium]
MSDLELLADYIEGRLYAAVVNDGVLTDLYVDPTDTTASWGSIYLGKVIKIDMRLEAALVDLGNGITGYLATKHIRTLGADESEKRTGLSEMLSGGQMILTQIKSEGKCRTKNENGKLPRLTMKVYVPGQFLVYSPTSRQVTISQRIENEKTLALTAKLKNKHGWIVQHHAQKVSDKEIEHESKYLEESWKSILSTRDANQGKPGLLKEGPNALFRALGDYGAFNFEHIHVGNKKILDLMMGWSKRHLPALATSKRLRLFKPSVPGQSLFDTHDIHTELEKLQESRIPLTSGGTIVIEQTTALTVIDVNQGNANNIPTVNLEASREIARQSRLRNLSGAILIDFISIDRKSEHIRLLEALTKDFTNDFAEAQVHGYTRLGIIEVTRKRRNATLSENLEKQNCVSLKTV